MITSRIPKIVSEIKRNWNSKIERIPFCKSPDVLVNLITEELLEAAAQEYPEIKDWTHSTTTKFYGSGVKSQLLAEGTITVDFHSDTKAAFYTGVMETGSISIDDRQTIYLHHDARLLVKNDETRNGRWDLELD